MDGRRFMETVPLFMSAAREGDFLTPELLSEISSSHSIRDIQHIPPEVREVFVTAHDIPPLEQIDLQASFQRHVDNAVSKTINLPMEASWHEVYEAIVYAHARGCKGLTVYREGSKSGQVLTTIRDANCCRACGRSLRAEEGALQCETCGSCTHICIDTH
jgi:ribonucleoside-diphosphate reductase alpha chain